MNTMPTNAECIFWIAALVVLAALILILAIINSRNPATDCYIEDMDAWSRNYAKIQRRH